MEIIGKDIQLAAELLNQNKLVAIPTETVYGLAANALNDNAVLSIFEAKQRPHFDPLIIHLATIEQISNYAYLEDERLIKLAKTFWPGPLTLLLPKKNNIPNIVTSGLDKVAVRIPNHPLTLHLLELLDFPLAAPSANPFGYVSPTNAEHVKKQLGNKIDYILDGGDCKIGLESTIVGIEESIICIYRLGGLTVEEIENQIGKVQLKINNSSNPKAPGQLKSHYAPKKPLFIGEINTLLKHHSHKKTGIICFGDEKFNSTTPFIYNLSKTKNLNEAAINLFNYLRIADEDPIDVVLCEKLPETGLGRAINDRLKRASH
ncbi:MAG: L-threonylcarbamoyladenylate synthase [Bacteroidota bacterium]|nr:L-threonylcarbamoyladenylate synthase [Bacteroidota bacterium]